VSCALVSLSPVSKHRASATPSRRRHRLLVAVLIILLLFAVATVRLFVLPARDSPTHADAIVVLGGTGDRVGAGVKLAREGLASNLIVSLPGQSCPAPIPGVQIRCFEPDPSTTQGEARYTAGMGRQQGWRHIIVVSTVDQNTRARLRFQRCTDIDVTYVTVARPALQWPYAIAYQWAALVKAFTLQRGC
jgi:uncharacterized SAM-binding protein YcdF (DUF218 family)